MTRLLLAVDQVSLDYLYRHHQSFIYILSTNIDKHTPLSTLLEIYSKPVILISADSIVLPKFASRLQPHVARYWIYQTMIKDIIHPLYMHHYGHLVHKEEKITTTAADSSFASPYPYEPLILLTDTRDVVFQANLFALTRQKIHRLYTSSSSSVPSPTVTSLLEQPSMLFVAVEPAPRIFREEAWNVETASSCFSPPIIESLGSFPIICSGTTVGHLYALLKYLEAMLRITPLCVMNGLGSKFGIDQPLHIYLAHTAMLTTVLRSAGLDSSIMPEGIYNSRHHPSDRFIPSTYTLPEGILEAYHNLYANLTTLPSHFTIQDKPYQLLNSIAFELINNTQILVLPFRHEEGPICTMANVPHRLVPFVSGGNDPGGLVLPQRVSIDNSHRVKLNSQTLQNEPLAPPTPCALVHQYDRHGRLVKLYDVGFLGVDPNMRYCEMYNASDCY